jgi:hypothetical protein
VYDFYEKEWDRPSSHWNGPDIETDASSTMPETTIATQRVPIKTATATALERVTHTIACLDKIVIRTKQPIKETEELKRNCHGFHKGKLNVKSKYDGKYVSHLIMPNEKAVNLVAKYNPTVTQVEGAIYFTTGNEIDNKVLQDYISTHIVFKNLRKTHDIVVIGETIYFMQRSKQVSENNWKWRRGRVTVIYGDRRCKPEPEFQFCVKVEERFQGAQVLDKQGLNTVKGALRYDWLNYFKERIELFDVDINRVGKQARKQKGNESDYLIGKGMVFKAGAVKVGNESKVFNQQFVKTCGRRSLKPVSTENLFANAVFVNVSRKRRQKPLRHGHVFDSVGGFSETAKNEHIIISQMRMQPQHTPRIKRDSTWQG